MSNIQSGIRVGNIELDGRILLPSVATYLCDDKGMVTDEVCEYYAQRAANKLVSLIITEHSFICNEGIAKANQISIASDDCISGLKKLTDVIHENGAKVIAQLNHAGSAAPVPDCVKQAVAPSAVVLPVNPVPSSGALPREMTIADIQEVIKCFAQSARRAKEAGYDGVEIHSAHSYLLNQFYSPLTNKRTDQYGGSLDNRLRLHREVIRAVRDVVGADYTLSLRLGGCDYMEGGSTIADSVYAAKLFQQESIDLMNVSGGMCRFTRPGHTEAGYFSDMTSAIKEAVTIPVILTGGVTRPDEAEVLIESGAADLIGVGRSLLKNAEWPDGE